MRRSCINMNAQTFYSQTRLSFFGDRTATAEYAKAHRPDDCAAMIALADLVCNQSFIFNLRWDMEKTEHPVTFSDEIDWLHQPGDDPEFIFAFNRMRFWITLGQAYALSGDEKYAKTFRDQLIHWVKTVKSDDPAVALAWRTIEVGLRLEYW